MFALGEGLKELFTEKVTVFGSWGNISVHILIIGPFKESTGFYFVLPPITVTSRAKVSKSTVI